MEKLKMLKKFLICGLIVFTVLILWVVYLEILEVRASKFDDLNKLNKAREKYGQVLSESKNFRSRYLAELDQILMGAAMNPLSKTEEKKISKRLSEVKEEIKKAMAKLANARKKFCDLAGEEEELCREEKEQAAAPPQDWPI